MRRGSDQALAVLRRAGPALQSRFRLLRITAGPAWCCSCTFKRRPVESTVDSRRSDGSVYEHVALRAGTMCCEAFLLSQLIFWHFAHDGCLGSPGSRPSPCLARLVWWTRPARADLGYSIKRFSDARLLARPVNALKCFCASANPHR